jgi:hypothetical protein
MQPHPDFDLQVHTDAELEAALGEALVERTTVHLWPLSSVERLTTVSGRPFAYKAQREPTVEPEFFAAARTTLLPGGYTLLQRDARQATVLIPWLTAPTLRDEGHDEAALVAQGRELVQEIGRIAGDVPVYRDLGTLPGWRGFVEETLGMLLALVDSQTFPNIAPEEIAALARWAQTPDVLEIVDTTSQLLHGDLKAEHVFRTDEGWKLLDWQRPCRAPGDIDLALLLESQKIDPGPYVAPAALGIRWFLLLHWACEAKTNLLPDLPFFEVWARQAIDAIRRTYDGG